MITILLSTYNGEKYLEEQLNSLMNQSFKDFRIIARDDGSSDATVEILSRYKIELLKGGKNVGAKQSFGLLLQYAVESSSSEYFMFCDQDDVWEADKIEKTFETMKKLEKSNASLPLLVHTDLAVVNNRLELLDRSYWRYTNIKPIHNNLFRLFMQNTVTGCTMMINKELATLSLPIKDNALMHDWWIALVASSFGKIGIVEDSTIRYRQHGKNEVGARAFNVVYIWEKALSIFTQDLQNQNILQASVFLETYKEMLNKQTLKKLEMLIDIQDKSSFEKRKLYFKYGLFKQGFLRNIGLYLNL